MLETLRMTVRRKCLIAAAVLAVVPMIFSLHGQNANTEPKGLVVTSSVLDRSTHVLTIGLQSKSNKTVVAYALLITQLDGNQEAVFPATGEISDFLEPDGSPEYILAGQPKVVRPTRIDDPRVLSAKVEVTAVVYLDGTYEGIGGAVSAVFDGRLKTAGEIRKSLAEERHSPDERTKLEKRAAFYENAAIPQEVK